jgi:hypothetical protein
MRRLYVEPKTRAKLREEGVITPQKRQRGLSGVRARRSAASAAGDAAAVAPVVDPVAVTAPLAADALRPALPSDGDRTPSGDPPSGLGALYDRPEVAASGAGEAATASVEPVTEKEVSSWLSSYLSATGHDGEEPDARVADGAREVEPVLAGGAAPDEQQPASGDGAEVPSRPPAEVAGPAQPEESRAQPSEVPSHARVTQPFEDAERREPLPGRPDTVPAVTLSWREAEVFDVNIPEAQADEQAIVVDPPSQVVAQSRARRRQLDVASSVRPDQGEPRPPVPADPEPPLLPTRASARAATGYRSGKRRRILVVGLFMVMLAVAATYFLLVDGGGVAVAR